jgi:hypothetical protein
MHNNRIRRFLESDEDKVVTLTAVVAATHQFHQDNTRQARRLLARTIRDCLEQVLGREATREEIARVLRGEM